jgi:hypothetical protein
MSVNTVQLHVQNLLNGLSIPNYQTPLVTYITPPNPGKLPGPAAYVWATTGTNRRQTAPRGAGFRMMTWDVSIWLMAPGLASDVNANTKFAGLIDTVTNALVTDTMPVMETDPITGLTFQLLAIGEDFNIQQSPVHALADQRLLMYEALISLTIKEASAP